MRFLIAPDKFKGSLSAEAAAEAIRCGILRAIPDAECELAPIADGGEGTAAAFHAALGGEWREVATVDARERPIRAPYLWLESTRTAVIDMSAAAGLQQIEPAQRDPGKATTFGTGELVAAAIRSGATTIYLGLGGSATNDAGAGLGAALGWNYFDADGEIVFPHPEHFEKIVRVQPPENSIPATVIGMADVTHPLLGPNGCSAVFGPQKGVRPEAIAALDSALRHFSDRVPNGPTLREIPGAGAAGGLGFGVLALANGRIESGFDVLSDLLNLPARLQRADYAITGEGRLDAQTFGGKGPAGVAELARAAGKPVIAIAGIVEAAARESGRFFQTVALSEGSISPEESMTRAGELLTAAAERIAHGLLAK